MLKSPRPMRAPTGLVYVAVIWCLNSPALSGTESDWTT